jgi:hypothetical protein
MALACAAMSALLAPALELSVINHYPFPTSDLERSGIAAEVDRIASATLGLAADAAVATLIRENMGRAQGESHRSAVT